MTNGNGNILISDQAIKAVQAYARLLIGFIVLIVLLYILVTGEGDADLLSRIVAFLFSILQIATGTSGLVASRQQNNS